MTIPILLYHEVEPRQSVVERYSVSSDAFREQMQYLLDQGYQTISLQQYRTMAMQRDPEIGKKNVIISFDDNNLSHYSISTRILSEFNFQATFFVVSSFIDTQPDMLSTAQLLEMKKLGMSIESHSHTHRFLSDLDGPDLREELEVSRRVLEDRTQAPVRYLSCPGGCYSSRVLKSALDVGYLGVCTSGPGLNELRGEEPPQELGRFLVSATTSLDTFAKIVGAEEKFVRGQIRRDRVKSLFKGLLGNDLYYRLWLRFRKNL
jgi:peptidoglycan/xylan/chitin deacetylase (PgdA/CDA1 family)